MLIVLSGVFYTHMWIHNRNTFVKVCEYRSSREISQYYFHSPAKAWVYDWEYCPPNIQAPVKQ